MREGNYRATPTGGALESFGRFQQDLGHTQRNHNTRAGAKD